MTLPVVFTANGPSGYNLTKSLRFRSSAQSYLNRTFGTPTNNKIWTYSVWIKRGSLAANRTIMSSNVDGAEYWDMRFNTSDQILIQNRVGSSNLLFANTTAVYRDPSAWYHIVFVFDSNNATAANRNLLYVNGVNVTLSANSGSSDASAWNVNSVQHNIGVSRTANPSGGIWAEYDGYEAEINFVDGQALTPSSFGQTSTTTGVWIPKKYTGTYGTNGFYLPFTDTTSTSTLGTDFSGNSNTWTVNNISLTAGTTYDSMNDVPTLTSATTANYAVFNPLNSANNGTLGGGNLNIDSNSGSASAQTTAGTMSMKSGKYYFEYTRVQASNGMYFGIIRDDKFISGGNVGLSVGEYGYFVEGNGTLYVDGSTTSSWITAFAQGNTAMVAYDADTGKVWLGRNGVWGGSGDPAAGTNPAATVNSFGSYGYVSYVRVIGGGSPAVEQGAINFGQQPFSYTPPTGFVALNTFNLPTPTIGATASSQANEYFDATLYTGNGGTLAVTNSGSMQPDFVWLKSRSAAYDHLLFDSIRGTGKALFSSSTAGETTTNNMSAFNSNGFTALYDATYIGSNNSGVTMVGWQWRASNTTAVTNTAGSITSTVSASTTAGFSIVTYTGTGANATVGHGLGVAPSMIIVKSRISSVNNWNIYNAYLTSAVYKLLFTTDAETSDATSWNSTAPTSSVFSLGTNTGTNANTETFVAYCFAQVAGYSAIGKYTGNGSTDGPFVYTGFRPRFVLVKESSAAGNNWVIYDTARDTYNECSKILYPNASNAEFDGSTVNLDILSNGFKPRDNWGGNNNSGNTYIYMAFAESPFKYANAR